MYGDLERLRGKTYPDGELVVTLLEPNRLEATNPGDHVFQIE